MYITALIRISDVKKIEPIMLYEGINAKVSRRSIAYAIAVVVKSRSSSCEFTISVHAVHAGVGRNACNIVVSAETPPNHHQSIAVVPLMPTRVMATQAESSLILGIFVTVSYLFRISVSNK